MKSIAFFIALSLISISAFSQVKKVTSEDLVTGKVEKWIEVTVDSANGKVLKFPLPPDVILNRTLEFPGIWKSITPSYNKTTYADSVYMNKVWIDSSAIILKGL